MSTWQRASEVVGWSFLVPALDGEDGHATLHRAVLALSTALPGFARATKIAATTASAGDDAYELKSPITPDALAQAFHAHPDTIALAWSLEGACSTESGDDLAIPNAADLSIDLDEDDGKVYVFLSLNVDIYAWRTWAPDRDNSRLASVNAPKLAAFLSRLKQGLNAQLRRIDNNSYDVDGDGFVRS